MTDFTQIISMEEQNMIFEKLKDIIAEQLSVDADKVTLEANIQEDLDADSLDIVDLITTIEDEFDISIPDEAVEEIKTVNDIVTYVENNADAE
jgi:acyl carrier protein